ncbi:hypothetical protein XU18_4461 [Perkinsela sp. CCAP 1560/4]|nr:hypothetical protein XU18_4461 [Perkinsela sp. CCAP 1560/4]|eukprot:KNH04251.1 hypothetical protein XU18_4461 [Perkinsela sp. CCAP 1560/4]
MSSANDENVITDEENTSPEIPSKEAIRTRSKTAKPAKCSHLENEKSAVSQSTPKSVQASRAIKHKRGRATSARGSIYERAKARPNSYVKWPLERRSEVATQIALLPDALLRQLLPRMWDVLDEKKGERQTMLIKETGYVFDFLAMSDNELDRIESSLLQCP